MSHGSMLSPGSRARRSGFSIAVAVAVLAALMFQSAPGRADGTCPTKPEVFPVDQLAKGMTAIGHTVIDGTSQTTFDVEILGVDENGIAPGVAFILAQITGPQSFLDQTGGIVAGMSGSPVYIGSKLVGSTSYGFAFADQTIIGITPAQPMVDLFDYPDSAPSSSAVAAARAASDARTVHLSWSLRQAGARAAGKSTTSSFPATADQLLVPLSVSGVDSRGLTRLERFVRTRLNLPVTVYGAAGSDPGAASQPLTAGDSLAAGLSYGDISAGAIGTATAACGDMVVGFGHPFFFNGNTQLGMNAADVLKVVKDPSSTFGGFKFATMTGLKGIIDQDRLTGIRGIDGLNPHLVNALVHVENLDIPGRMRDGESQVAAAEFVPIVAALTLLGNQDVTFDRIGDGSAALDWSIQGTGPDGEHFKLIRDDKYYSGYDISYESITELLYELFFLQNNKFGDVTFTNIRANSAITQRQLTTRISKVLVSSNTQPGLEERTKLLVSPGDTIHIRVVMRRLGLPTPLDVNMSFAVPASASGDGELSFRGGRFFDGLFSARRAGSFDAMLSKFENAEHGYDLVSEMFLFAGGGSEPGPKASAPRRFIHREIIRPQGRVVGGRKFIRLRVVNAG
ncbi:MAG TPA: SpoIVB peptidase S55 domain-containing protein [Actinomycetota bacterium]